MVSLDDIFDIEIDDFEYFLANFDLYLKSKNREFFENLYIQDPLNGKFYDNIAYNYWKVKAFNQILLKYKDQTILYRDFYNELMALLPNNSNASDDEWSDAWVESIIFTLDSINFFNTDELKGFLELFYENH